MNLKVIYYLLNVIIISIPYKNKKLIYGFIVEIIKTKSGHITENIKGLLGEYSFTTIYKFIERSKWNAISVHQEFVLAVIKVFKIKQITIIIDDTIIYRSRKKTIVKGSHLYDHSNKANRSKYVWGQNMLMLAVIIKIMGKEITLPVMIHLIGYKQKDKSNEKRPEFSSNKITSAGKMLSIVKLFLEKHKIEHKNTIILFDAFFAKKRVILSVEEFKYIFQIRKDTALFEYPKEKKIATRGRKKKYGKRILINEKKLDQKVKMFIYGKEQTVQYTAKICKARFLDGKPILAVWSKLENSKKIHLYLSTDTSLDPIQMLTVYSKRWNIEPLFNELKNIFGFKDIWLQKDIYYQKFLHLKLWSFIISKLSMINNLDIINKFVTDNLPWRIKSNNRIIITSGITQLTLSHFLGLLNYDAFVRKSKKLKYDSILSLFIALYLTSHFLC
jgi:hypothetical protein